jgi:hypothetical protein
MPHTGRVGIHRSPILCHSNSAHQGFSPHLDDRRVFGDMPAHPDTNVIACDLLSVADEFRLTPFT